MSSFRDCKQGKGLSVAVMNSVDQRIGGRFVTVKLERREISPRSWGLVSADLDVGIAAKAFP